MRKFLIATHGTLASGFKSALDLIIGDGTPMALIQAYLDGNHGIGDELEAVRQQLQAGDELVIFTDLLGGSITNQVLMHLPEKQVHVVSGINLPLVMEIVLSHPAEAMSDVIEQAIGNAKDQLVYVNRRLDREKETNTYD